jgi:hypothetical protein
VVSGLKGLAERLALFTLKYFMLGENTGIKERGSEDKEAIRFTGARLPFGVSSNLSYYRSYRSAAFRPLRYL